MTKSAAHEGVTAIRYIRTPRRKSFPARIGRDHPSIPGAHPRTSSGLMAELDAPLVSERIALAAGRMSTLRDDSCISVSDTVRYATAERVVADYEGFVDERTSPSATVDAIAHRALADCDYAATDVSTLRVRRALMRYGAAVGEILEACPSFARSITDRVNGRMLRLVDEMWRSGASMCQVCDVVGVSLQRVAPCDMNLARSGANGEQKAMARRTSEELRRDAAELEMAAARLRRRADLILEASGILGVAPPADQPLPDGPRILFHGRDLLEFPETRIPARPGQTITFRVHARAAMCLVGFDPRPIDAYENARGALSALPTTAAASGDTVFVDYRVGAHERGARYMVDLSSHDMTLKLAGAHLFIVSAKDSEQERVCAWADRALKRARAA